MELAVMHMSGAYLAQDFYREPFGCPGGAESREIDCRDIEGTRSYCDDRAKERLRELPVRNIRSTTGPPP